MYLSSQRITNPQKQKQVEYQFISARGRKANGKPIRFIGSEVELLRSAWIA